jgi:sorting nexin-7/30/sorting nexin-8
MSKFENVHIEMSLGEKVAGTFFTKAYMTYIITTSPINLKVRRRYSDFEWLRQILLNFYSSSLIPPIPKKIK